MAKAYSYELRQKVVNAMQLDGMPKSEAAQVFNLSRNTIDLWLKRTGQHDCGLLPKAADGSVYH